MKIDWVIYAFDNVIHRKLRSFLTVLSILIGVMVIASSMWMLMILAISLAFWVFVPPAVSFERLVCNFGEI